MGLDWRTAVLITRGSYRVYCMRTPSITNSNGLDHSRNPLDKILVERLYEKENVHDLMESQTWFL